MSNELIRAGKAARLLYNTKYSLNEEAAKSLTRHVAAHEPLQLEDIPTYATKIFLLPIDSVTAVHEAPGERRCLLNFASYTTPGGGFVKGRKSQEEDICRGSGLYECLLTQRDVYIDHRKDTNDSLYGDDYIYSVNVPFERDGNMRLCDVLTCAAPNAKRTSADTSVVQDVFGKRIEMVYTAPIRYGVKHFIIGAWGCGVFGNDPEFVARKWFECMKKYQNMYMSVTIAIPDKRTFDIFESLIKKCLKCWGSDGTSFIYTAEDANENRG